jgi:hypothetical protein
MRTETPRIRQLTFQLEHAPYVLTRCALAAVAGFLPGPEAGVSTPEVR